ncbi:sodium channel protein para [Trichonephila inaurata madagascariensis]|uniref:Sodium channel protein n=1 Tax=Trichonephila inaurata madagascariensis TaxID=2747483 RepID=A0A8X7BRD4_9ARAC|nr:sodium channel protein para [Trichonephila inaurata madagascariensis]
MIEVFNLSSLVLRNCIKRLFQAFILILFFGSTFILLGKQLYKGVLTQKCVILPPLNITHAEYAAFVGNSSNWLENKNGYYLCGNSTGSRPCPQNHTCLRGADVNTYISNFNFYGSSVVTISQLMTLHFWQELYQKMLLTAGTLHVSYFILAFYSFLYSSGLILAIITRSYKNVLKEFEIIEKKSRLAKKDGSYICDSQKGIVKSPSCKSYELFSSQVISSERVERQTSEIIENTNRAAERNFESDSGLKEHLAESRQKREAVRCQLAREKSTESNDQSASTSACSSVFRQHLKRFISNFSTELFFLASIASYLCIVIVQYSNLNFIPLEIALYCYYVFAGITLVEVTLKMIAYSPKEYFRSKWNAFDCLVLIIAGTELTLLDVEHPILFTLRAYKLVKLMVCCNTFALKNALESCIFLFRHPTSILFVFIIICIVTGMQLYGHEYFHSADRFPDQEPPRWFFKDFYSSFILVFCMLCGDWKQPMVNTVLFTSYSSDLLMLIFVLIGNFVIINLFLGIVFYTFFYKSLPRNAASEDKLHSAIQVILNRQVTVSDTITSGKQSKSDNSHQNDSSASDTVSETQDNSTKIFKKNKKKQLHNQREMEIMEDSSSEYMDDCCPSLCYFCCSFCKADENPVLWQNWADIRCRLYWFVETKCFRVTISLIIIFSVAMLVCEQSHKSRYPEIAFIIKILSPVIFMLFFFEMVLKWMAYGLQKFFKSHLGRFEFFILVIYLIDLLSIKFFDGQKNIFKALRAFRLLSLTSLLKSYQETLPLPMKHNSCLAGSESVSNESLLHLRQFECNRFLGRHCRYRPTGSGEIFQMDWNAPEIQSADLSGSRMRRIELGCTADYRDRNPTIMAQDCLPVWCHNTFPFCRQDCSFFRFCSTLRTKVTIMLKSRYFFSFVVIMILISNCQLAVELNFSSEKLPIIEQIAAYTDKVFACLFFIEMLLKMFGFGIKSYCSNFWCILELITTLATVSYIVLHEFGFHEFFALKMVRVFRLVYLYKTLKFNKQSKAILTSLKRALPSHFLVFFFVFYMWLIFAVMGTAMFSGMLHRCLDINNQVLALSETACLQNNGTYKTSPVNFDSVAHAFIGLLQVSNEVKNEVYTATFFPLFIMFSTFLTLNLFVGVTCWYFNDQKRDSDNNLNSRTNALYKAAVRKMENVKLEKTIPPPKLHFQAFVYRMVSSDNFEMASFVFIGLHMLLIALDMYDPDPSEMFALAMFELNIFFIVIFSIEAILKLIAYRQYYFLSFWNHFDVVVLTLCICGTLFENLFSSPMLPAMLRLIRFIKCRRYLRRYIRGMLPLLYTLYSSIPAFVSIVIIQFIIMFIYATFGVYLFHNIKQSWDISGELSFETFPKAMLLLFQLSTLAGWIDVLHCLSASGENLTSATFFVVSYIIIVYYIIIKTHLVVILDSFETAMWEYENILLKEDYEMFAEVWQKFDNNARGIIKFSNLPDLLDVLEEPFHFCKPNRYLIATLNIPIYEGDLVFYADVMDALTRDFMSHKAHLVEIPDSIPGLLDNKGKTLKKIGSTLWRQRQNHCAYVIQRAWRRYTGKLVRSPVFYSEVRLADQGDKVDTYLAAEVRSGSHASV